MVTLLGIELAHISNLKKKLPRISKRMQVRVNATFEI